MKDLSVVLMVMYGDDGLTNLWRLISGFSAFAYVNFRETTGITPRRVSLIASSFAPWSPPISLRLNLPLIRQNYVFPVRILNNCNVSNVISIPIVIWNIFTFIILTCMQVKKAWASNKFMRCPSVIQLWINHLPHETKQLFKQTVQQQNLSWILDWCYWAYQQCASG